MAQQSGSGLVVERVSGRKQLKAFIAFPHRIYADDPNWVAPLWFEQLQRFTDKNPFFEHATWQAWVVRRGERIVGRISAQIDDLFMETQGEKTGFFGLIEAEDDAAVFALLFETAENWLRERGIETIRGPFNLSLNEECGLLVEGFDSPPYIMMGHARPYYDGRINAAGYVKAKDLFAYETNPDQVLSPVMQRLHRSIGKNVTVRPFRRKQLKEELAILRDIFNDSWAGNWGFTPFTEAEFADVGELITLLIDDEYIQIAEIEGRPVAMFVAVPDINQAAKDLHGRLLPFGWLKLLWRLKVRYPSRARTMLMGVRQEFQNKRLGPVLAFMVLDAARQALVRRKIDQVEMSWVLEDNEGMKSIALALGGVLHKRYRIYEKSL
ncbi:MAG: N-acetyltransferase [Gammaproteobacteria bacterium]|nr:N-acetyltransferase [Gammaproteobacteria bacterium]